VRFYRYSLELLAPGGHLRSKVPRRYATSEGKAESKQSSFPAR